MRSTKRRSRRRHPWSRRLDAGFLSLRVAWLLTRFLWHAYTDGALTHRSRRARRAPASRRSAYLHQHAR